MAKRQLYMQASAKEITAGTSGFIFQGTKWWYLRIFYFYVGNEVKYTISAKCFQCGEIGHSVYLFSATKYFGPNSIIVV